MYSAVMHYLKAIDASGPDEAKAVIAHMKAMPINDFFRQEWRSDDGRMVTGYVCGLKDERQVPE